MRNVRSPLSPEFKKQVADKCHRTCQVCGEEGLWDPVHSVVLSGKKKFIDFDCTRFVFVSMEFDHIVPLFLGGETTLDNMQILCRKCNRRKGYKHG